MNLTTSAILGLVALFGAGAALAVQAPINTILARSAGGLLPTAALSFLVGFLGLVLLLALRGEIPSFHRLGEAPWWAWLGGAIGVLYLVVTMWTVPKLGVLSVTVALILGQLVAGLLLDRIGAFGLAVHEITWPRILGVAMVLSGLVMTRL